MSLLIQAAGCHWVYKGRELEQAIAWKYDIHEQAHGEKSYESKGGRMEKESEECDREMRSPGQFGGQHKRDIYSNPAFPGYDLKDTCVDPQPRCS